MMMMSSLGSNAHRRVIRGVVFDMDGTLIAPSINFAEMR